MILDSSLLSYVYLVFYLDITLQQLNYYQLKTQRFVPEIIRKKEDLGDGHTAIVYFTHGEPEDYNPIGWINQFREFDQQKLNLFLF